ncbi:MAG TPA: FliH/SctL family protein [Clostridia bacterium]|nr:FliH/SctL family protein [Clostridia bacterium]
MSKIYKSDNISIGAPKPIVNIFKSMIKSMPDDKETALPEENDAKVEEAANNIIEDAKQMYLKIIKEANSEARAVAEAAEKEAQLLRSEAMEEGQRQGYEAGYLEGRRDAQSVIDEASEIRELIDSRRDEIYREAEEEIVQLVLDIAKKVIGDELTQNKEAILSLINQALQKCAFKKKLILKVSPQDSDLIIENKDRICMMAEGISDIDIVPDLSLAQGSCIIETSSGEINSGIDVQIREIEKIFTYILRNE